MESLVSNGGMYSQQQQKNLEKKLSERYAENRNLRDRVNTLVEKMGSAPGSQVTTTESSHPLLSRRPNTNECGDTWEDVLAFLTNISNEIKSTKQAAGTQQAEFGHQSLDSVG